MGARACTLGFVTIRSQLVALYRGLDDGFVIPEREERAMRRAGSDPLYGEITPAGARTLLDALQLDTPDEFVDLGAGVGRLMLQVAMTSGIRRCVGVELSPARCRSARRALLRARARGLIRARRCVVKQEDLMTFDLSTATVLYCCSTAFSIKALARLASRIRDLGRPVTLVTFQDYFTTPRQFEKTGELRVATTWHRRCPVHIYRAGPLA